MRVLLFGATGMIGQGVLRECLQDPDVQNVLSIVRHSGGREHPKLQEIVHENFLDFSRLEPDLTGLDACLFCLGVSSAGMTEDDYRRVTYDITLAAARTLARLNPDMTFIYVSGAGTDSTEQGRSMWARVKGMTENAIFRLPFKAAYMFRPAGIQPLHGITSRTRLYRLFYAAARPLFPLLHAILPHLMTTTEQLGRAMLAVAKHGFTASVIESRDINRI